jgi:mannose-6-phosphate isomerase-like protein (cupin superfamily)
MEKRYLEYKNSVSPFWSTKKYGHFWSRKNGKKNFVQIRAVIGHSHKGMDKAYQVIAGLGLFLLEDKEIPMETGCILVAPENVPHGILNNSEHRLIVLAILTPSPWNYLEGVIAIFRFTKISK